MGTRGSGGVVVLSSIRLSGWPLLAPERFGISDITESGGHHEQRGIRPQSLLTSRYPMAQPGPAQSKVMCLLDWPSRLHWNP
ncbi:hypothetical protein QFZ68_004921 [Streptomyces sp. V1I6]|nr:hypothetical protein [Streptomyces sp. V1I6]